jgi:predicted heme/steroid binding protein/uncharacterized membrane protein
MRKFTRQELAEFDGLGEKPAYVAHEGRVFDVSASKLWRDGQHMRRHSAGSDLTTELQAAPHGPDRLGKFPQVGTLDEGGAEAREEGRLGALFERFPMLRRHPHPMTVHFPLAFALSAPVFALLSALTGRPAFDSTAHHCVWAAFLTAPGGILTGYVSWRVNYLGKPLREIRIKQILAFLLWGLALALLLWRAGNPAAASSTAYVALLVLLAALAGGLGWFGGHLTFPVARRRTEKT